MKIIAIISLLLGLLAIGSGLYCMNAVIPAMEGIDRLSLGGKLDVESYAYQSYRRDWIALDGKKGVLDAISLIGGGLGLLGGIFAGVKKAKLGWLAAIISSVGLVIGLLQGTHMFS